VGWVSVTELTSRGGEFERTPPHDLAAEQCVLGGMLMSKDAISDVMDVIRPHDHYRPAHQLVHEAILELYARGEPADPVTVSDLLAKRGELARIGGGAYLHTLLASVPTAANAGYYARIVRERAILRRLVEAGTRIVQLGYTGDGDADELVDRAEAEIYGVTERRVTEDFLPLSEIMPGALDEIEAIGSRGGVMTGVPTGFSSLDSLTNGLHPGQMVVIAARPSLGKALAVDTPLPTPTGWTTMGEIAVGEQLLGADGRPVTVVATTEIMYGRPCYEVGFDDGARVIADADHQWRTTTRVSRRQAAEHVTKFYWSGAQVERVLSAAARAQSEADRRVTTMELLNEVGQEFRNVLRAVVIKKVRPLGREARTCRRRVSRGVGVREYPMPLPVYSRRDLLSGLAKHALMPKLAAQSHRHGEIKTTADIAATLRHVSRADRRWNHAIPVCGPLGLPERNLPLPPYTLGVWLGDGNANAARYTSADPEIALYIEADGMAVTDRGGYIYSFRFPRHKHYPVLRDCTVCGKPFLPKAVAVKACGRSCGGHLGRLGRRQARPTCRICGTGITGTLPGYLMCKPCLDRSSATGVLRELGVLDNKHIPASYLRASEQQRRELLAGLLDTDGTVQKAGSVQFTVTSLTLAEDVRELIWSLGYRCGWSEKKVKGRTSDSSIAYTITFTTSDDVFRLERKQIAHKERRRATAGPRTRQRFITKVRSVASVPVRCVQVASADGMFLVGRSMIPTHNSTLALDLARAAAVKHGQSTVMFSLEMSRNEITMRLLSAEARVALQHMRTGQLGEDDWARLARRMSEVVDAPLFIDDSPNVSMMEIRAKCRRLKQRHSLRLVIIDYLQLMSSPKRVENRQQEVSEMSRSLKLLAKELDVPVVAVSQLNRGPEQRNDKRPLLSDLRESGSIEQDSDVVILLHREDAYEPESPRAGEADLIVAKHRNGPTAVVTVAFQGHYSRFVDMAPG
jgi:replicative DNA helicase